MSEFARQPPSAAVSQAADAGPARCDQCQALCCRLTVVLEAGDDIPPAFTTVTEAGLRVMARDDAGWCKALEPGSTRCGIYATRPAVCGRFVMDGPYCNAVREDFSRRDIPLALC